MRLTPAVPPLSPPRSQGRTTELAWMKMVIGFLKSAILQQDVAHGEHLSTVDQVAWRAVQPDLDSLR